LKDDEVFVDGFRRRGGRDGVWSRRRGVPLEVVGFTVRIVIVGNGRGRSRDLVLGIVVRVVVLVTAVEGRVIEKVFECGVVQFVGFSPPLGFVRVVVVSDGVELFKAREILNELDKGGA
jgi:hypothetical protein